MPEMHEYEYEIDGKIVYFYKHMHLGAICARVNNKATYRKTVPNGKWMVEGSFPGRNNELTHEQLESVWERHIAAMIVDGEPKRWDPWRKMWVIGEESS